MDKFWMLCVFHLNTISGTWEPRGNPKFVHNTYEAATKEAVRLSQGSPGEKVVILAATGFYEIPKPVKPPPEFTVIR